MSEETEKIYARLASLEAEVTNLRVRHRVCRGGGGSFCGGSNGGSAAG